MSSAASRLALRTGWGDACADAAAHLRRVGAFRVARSLACLALSVALGACAPQPSLPGSAVATSSAPTPVAVSAALDRITPAPAQVAVADGVPLRIDAASRVQRCPSDTTGEVVDYFLALMQRGGGLALQTSCAADDTAAITFGLDPDLPMGNDEGYRLEVGATAVNIRARSQAGLFYGAVSLWQLLTAVDDAAPQRLLARGRIDDAPRFAWRGLMLDSARHYQSPDFIKRLIDAMALHKLNTLHWHLTDDQGWRIEIKKHPRLTEVGAWRVPPGPAAAAEFDPATGQPRRYGGYYTHEEIRDIVRYAATRHIRIIPEIDMPGHAQAAIAAYPALGTGDTPGVSVDWGVHTYILNVDEATFAFVDDVLAEVAQLFPAPYVHVGGDEAVKDRWAASPAVQAQRKKLGLANDAALQAWFVQRLESALAKHGKKLIGWDEILEGGKLPASASVMSWRGSQGAIDAARAGHDVVLSPSPDLYLDNLQSDAADEPSGRPYLVTLEKLYHYELTPAELDADQARHVLGAQVNVWTEHMRTTARIEHAVFPRLAALAEATWSPRTQRNWAAFRSRLGAQLQRYRRLGIAYAPSAVAVRIEVEPIPERTDRVRVRLATQTGIGDIRFRLGGAEPDASSALYQAPLEVPLDTFVSAAAFDDARALHSATTQRIDRSLLSRRRSAELKPCRPTGLVIRLEDDAPVNGDRPIYSVDLFDACWIWPQADLRAVGRIDVTVGNLPYNFQLWHDTKNIVVRPATTPEGELEIRRDGCDSPVWLRLPLKAALSNPTQSHLGVALPQAPGLHDLCFTFARPDAQTLWAIDEVRLLP